MADSEYKDIDYILVNYIGGGGWAQWRIVLLQLFIGFACSTPLLLHMLAAYTPDHRCEVQICENSIIDDSNTLDWKTFALPMNAGSSNFLKEDEHYDTCTMFQVKEGATECLPESFTEEIIPCEKWIYDQSSIQITLATEHNLVCDQEHKRRLLGVMMMLGLMIGSLLGGKMGDYFGRKKSIYGAICIIFPSVILAGYPGTYEVYAALRFLTCAFLPVIWVSLHSLTLEYFSPDYREIVIGVKDTFYPVLLIILCGISYLTRHHFSYLHLSIGIASSLSLMTFWFIPESVRWEVINGKEDNAMKTLQDMARLNGRKLTQENKEEISLILSKIAKESLKEVHGGKFQIWDLFSSSQLKKTMILAINWVTVCVGSYTLTLNATKLSGNVWINFLLTAVAEFPMALIIYLMLKRFGRRFNLFFFQLLLGSSCIILAFIPKSMTWLVISVYLIGKSAAGAGFVMVWLVPVELYPTNLRAQALGTFSTIARLFGLASSFVATLAFYWKPLPMLVLGVPTVCASFLTYFLPETSGMDLPQTMAESNKLNIESKINPSHQTTPVKHHLLDKDQDFPNSTAEKLDSLISTKNLK